MREILLPATVVLRGIATLHRLGFIPRQTEALVFFLFCFALLPMAEHFASVPAPSSQL
jgi:hypothetical protein